MTRRPVGLEIALIALLCFLAYAPTLSIPLLEDDYPLMLQAQLHGSPAEAPGLLHDPIFRFRATTFWLMFGLWKAFGLAPVVFHCVSLVLHFANCCVVYAIVRLCLARADSAAFWAAAFFAVCEGHQEAVMWFSACNELLPFLFCGCSLVCWLRGREEAGWARRLSLEGVGIVAFGLALISKETAIVWLPLFLLVGAGFKVQKPESRLKPAALIRLLPHAALAALAVALVWSTREYSFRFSDGSFSFAAPFWVTWTRSFARMLWVWGWLALAGIAWLRDSNLWKQALAALAWIGIGLAPYSFLTYSTQIPSRQTYVASAGLALLFGLGMAGLSAAHRVAAKRLAALAAVAMVVSNTGYLWTKKRAQFIERAEPTEQLIRLARQTPGPIWMECFPRNHYIAEGAVRVGAGRTQDILIWSQAEATQRRAAATFCYRER